MRRKGKMKRKKRKGKGKKRRKGMRGKRKRKRRKGKMKNKWRIRRRRRRRRKQKMRKKLRKKRKGKGKKRRKRKRGSRKRKRRKGKMKKKWRMKKLRRRKRIRQKMRKRLRKFKPGRKSTNPSLVQILERLNEASYRSAAIRGTSIGLANRLIRRLMRAHRVAMSWRSLRRRWPLVRTVKVFTVLLRRAEMIIAALRRRQSPPRRRPDHMRRLKLALLYLYAISSDLRLAADVIRARTGARVLNMLQLAVRTQRDAMRRLLHSTSRRQKIKLKKPHGAYLLLHIVSLLTALDIMCCEIHDK